jgi:hypothetical protein
VADMSWTFDEIEAGADALRRYEQGGKQLRLWADLPNSTKNKWKQKALAVLVAAQRERTRSLGHD